MSRAAHRGPLLTTIWRLHRLWYRLSDGRLGAKSQGWDVLLLTTTGRTTGARRSVARDPSYDEYERRTKRRIPVVLLEPRV